MINNVFINEVMNRMSAVLSEMQLKKLFSVFYEVEREMHKDADVDYIEKFISAKKLEGCSRRTEEYYGQTLRYFEKNIGIKLIFADSESIRTYLSDYQKRNNCSNITLDNVRRILSSFYRWLENEDYIVKSPMKRIHKVKTPIIVKTTFTEEEIEMLRNDFSCNRRNLAIFNLLNCSGIRIGELIKLDVDDINLSNRSGIVKGKGNKERFFYFDVKTKLSIENYLKGRTDNNPALFVSLRKYTLQGGKKRISINGIESLIRNTARKLTLPRAYPHKFRRTIATKAIDKGMPIEQVQILLGHARIDTTLKYAQVQQRNVMHSYQKYMT